MCILAESDFSDEQQNDINIELFISIFEVPCCFVVAHLYLFSRRLVNWSCRSDEADGVGEVEALNYKQLTSNIWSRTT
jgi:hypothetical protein